VKIEIAAYTSPPTKRRGSSGLLAKDMVSKNDQRFPRMTASQFLRKAWTAANDKARELGWIV